VRTAFTLLELLVVLVLVALLTAIVAVRLMAPLQKARLESAVQRVAFIDSQTRTHARSASTGCQIVCELDSGRIFAQDASGHGHVAFDYRVPGALCVQRVLSAQLDCGSGTARIEVSARGTSCTYAICLSNAQHEKRWLLFAGLTGQIAYPKDDADVQAIFEFLEPARLDAY